MPWGRAQGLRSWGLMQLHRHFTLKLRLQFLGRLVLAGKPYPGMDPFEQPGQGYIEVLAIGGHVLSEPRQRRQAGYRLG
jgi:hypothetical protein